MAKSKKKNYIKVIDEQLYSNEEIEFRATL